MKRAWEGDTEAMVEFGMMFINGTDGPDEYPHPQSALIWFLRAAKQGNIDGQFIVAEAYRQPLTLREMASKDRWHDEEIDYWLSEKCLESCVDEMANWWDEVSAKTIRIGKHINRAEVWYEKAAQGGHIGAKDALEKLRAQKALTVLIAKVAKEVG